MDQHAIHSMRPRFDSAAYRHKSLLIAVSSRFEQDSGSPVVDYDCSKVGQDI